MLEFDHSTPIRHSLSSSKQRLPHSTSVILEADYPTVVKPSVDYSHTTTTELQTHDTSSAS